MQHTTQRPIANTPAIAQAKLLLSQLNLRGAVVLDAATDTAHGYERTHVSVTAKFGANATMDSVEADLRKRVDPRATDLAPDAVKLRELFLYKNNKFSARIGATHVTVQLTPTKAMQSMGSAPADTQPVTVQPAPLTQRVAAPAVKVPELA